MNIVELKDTVDRSKLEAEAIMAELKEKNTESESIRPNLVSKETFIRTQFQKLQLRQRIVPLPSSRPPPGTWGGDKESTRLVRPNTPLPGVWAGHSEPNQ